MRSNAGTGRHWCATQNIQFNDFLSFLSFSVFKASGRRQIPLFLFSRSSVRSSLLAHFLPMSAEELHPLEHGTFWKAADGPTAAALPMHELICWYGDRRRKRWRVEPHPPPLALGGVIGLLSFPPRFPPGRVELYQRSRRENPPND